MCAKWKLAESLSALSVDITNTLCRTKGENGQPDEECPYAATCPYLRQLAIKRPGLLLAAHNYISLTVEGLKAEGIDCVIVDESFWQSMCRQGAVSAGQFQRPRGPGMKGYYPKKGETRQQYDRRIVETSADFEDLLNKTRKVLFEAQQTKQPLDLEQFRAAGITAEACRFAVGVEFSRLGRPNVTAGMPYAEQADRIQAAKVDEAYGFARVWKILATELELPRNQLLGLKRNERRWNPKAEAFEDVLETHYHPEARIAGIPLVLIDADLDEAIAQQFYPVAGKVLTLDVAWSNVCVRQVLDRAVSRNMLAGSNPRADEQQRHANRREDLWAIMQDMAERHGHPLSYSPDARQQQVSRARRPLLVTYKAVEDAWADAGCIEGTGAPDTPLRNALPFDLAHLGDIRGKDGWKHATGIVVAGRLEPTVTAVESLARAVFYADAGELAFVLPGDDGQARYETVRRPVLFRDGTEEEVDVSAHPDARVDAVLRQIREAELLQALARIRPVHRGPGAPCEVVVATNVPLPGLLVDEAVSWKDLAPDRVRRMELAGFVPDLAADCAAAYPEMFPSAAAARQARSRAGRARSGAAGSELSGCDKAHLESLFGICHTPAEYVRVEYLRPASGGGNRRGSGSVRAHAGETEAVILARLAAALPDAFAVRVVGSLPDAGADPERAAIMRAAALEWLGAVLETDDVGCVRSLGPVEAPPEAVGPPDWPGECPF
jgi:hypothetical protein